MTKHIESRTPTMQEMLKYWYEDISVETMAEKLGTTVNKIYALRRKYKLPKRSKIDKTGRVEYEPTPKQIEEAAAFVRSTWTPTQEMARRVGWRASTTWSPPTFLYDSRTGIFTQEDR